MAAQRSGRNFFNTFLGSVLASKQQVRAIHAAPSAIATVRHNP